MKFIGRWYTYQKERFPVLIYGLYVFCIAFATFCFTSYLRCNAYKYMGVECNKLWAMFGVAFIQFLMVRIIDEFKDYEEDCKYRPYRPVPRGVVSLSELKVLFVICVIAQLVITILFNKIGLIFLGMLWIYFALMSKEFYLKKIIDKHILFGVLLDEILMIFLVLYLASFIYIDFHLIWPILLLSYFISWIVEVARKIRCKEDEENGVKTYTAVFGIEKATFLLWLLEAIVLVLVSYILKNVLYGIIAFNIVSVINVAFMINQNKFWAKLTELSGNIYIMFMYLIMYCLFS